MARGRDVDDGFDGASVDFRWKCVAVGGGLITQADSVLRLTVADARAGAYCDAQIDDYENLRRSHFLWRPPLRMEVRARASLPARSPDHAPLGADNGEQHFLRGTFGFGLWNYPFSLSQRAIRLPDAVWFFGASPPSNMALVPGSPGYGWKAQVVHADRLGVLACAIPTALSVLWGRLTGREAMAARWVQRLSGASERLLAEDLAEWHTYSLDWLPRLARFAVDGAEVLRVGDPPQGPLGFVAWIDNQYAVATPRGAFHFGTLASGPETLELDSLRITKLKE